MTLLIELDTIFELTKPQLENQVHPLFDRVADKLMHHLLKTKHLEGARKISVGEDKYPWVLF